MIFFYGREFELLDGVLKPSPTGVALVELYKRLQLVKPHILDVGSGAGHLGVTAALESGCASVSFIDNSQQALSTTMINVSKHQLGNKATFHFKDFQADECMKHPDVILTNLNYIPDIWTVDTDEPHSAIYGGRTGMELYADFWKHLKKLNSKAQHVLTVCLPEQFSRMDSMARQAGYIIVGRLGYASCYEKRSNN